MTIVVLQTNDEAGRVTIEVKWRWINVIPPGWTCSSVVDWAGPIKPRLCVPAEPLLNSLTRHETSQ